MCHPPQFLQEEEGCRLRELLSKSKSVGVSVGVKITRKGSLKNRMELLKKYFLIIITMMIAFKVIYEEN